MALLPLSPSFIPDHHPNHKGFPWLKKVQLNISAKLSRGSGFSQTRRPFLIPGCAGFGTFQLLRVIHAGGYSISSFFINDWYHCAMSARLAKASMRTTQQDSGHLFYHQVACQMAERIVHPLKIVQIEKQERQVGIIPFGK